MGSHVAVLDRAPQAVGDRAVAQGSVAQAVAEPGFREVVRGEVHALHAAGHDEVGVAGPDGGGGQHDRLQAAAADPVDRRRGHRRRKPGRERRLARRRLPGPGLEDLAHVDLVERRVGREPGTLDGGPDRDAAEPRRRHVRERASEAPDGRPRGGDDVGSSPAAGVGSLRTHRRSLARHPTGAAPTPKAAADLVRARPTPVNDAATAANAAGKSSMMVVGHAGGVDLPRLGRTIRVLRLRAGYRQVDVAVRAGISRSSVSAIERGEVVAISVASIEAVCRAVGATLDVAVRWHGTEFDRLLNAGHSAMHEAVAVQLVDLGWEVLPEVTFSIYGERGAIDIVAWHAPSATLLVIELKTELVDVQALVGSVDRYRRLAPAATRDRGWVPAAVAAWVIVADTATNRRRLAAHRTMLRAAFPVDGRMVGSWLRDPHGPTRALSFLDVAEVRDRTATRGSRQRVRCRGAASEPRQPAPSSVVTAATRRGRAGVWADRGSVPRARE